MGTVTQDAPPDGGRELTALQIHLLTGEATLLGYFDEPMVDIALPLRQ
jgi:hypothetical protein